MGTGGHFTVEEVSEQLKNLIVTRFSDLLAESKIPVLDMAANYNNLSAYLTGEIAPEFLEYGIEVTKLLVENIALPSEVEEALDKKSSMGIIGNLDNFLKFQSANAMEAAAKNPGGEASAGVGMGMGFAIANQLGKMVTNPQEQPVSASTPPPLEEECKYFVGKNGKQAGPYDKNTIVGYIRNGIITKETLMWKQGMAEWSAAEHFNEFEKVLETTPPPLPI